MKKVIAVVLVAIMAGVGVKAQEVITLSQGQNVKVEKVTPLYRPTGHNIRIAVGAPVLLGVEYNRWLTPWFMVGAGTGFGIVGGAETLTVPAYTSSYGYYHPAQNTSYSRAGFGIPWHVEAEFRTPQYKRSLFFNLKVGYGVGVKHYGYYKDSFYDGMDENGNVVYGEVTYDWKPFFMLATIGFSYKRFSVGVGAGVLGSNRCANLMIAYDIPLK